jgi:hypothetical protein
MLLSTDKSFVAVQSAPLNYSPNVALLLQYLQPDQEANVEAVITYLIECLEDERPFKKNHSLILLFCSAMFKGLREFQNPNTFQFCLTHVKHALKGAALVKFRKNTSSAKRDAEWAEKFLHCNHCAMQQLQYWKRAARRNIVQIKEEKIRWTAVPGIVHVLVDKHSGTWQKVQFKDYARLLRTCMSQASNLMRDKLQVQLLAPEDLEHIKDPVEVCHNSRIVFLFDFTRNHRYQLVTE